MGYILFSLGIFFDVKITKIERKIKFKLLLKKVIYAQTDTSSILLPLAT